MTIASTQQLPAGAARSPAVYRPEDNQAHEASICDSASLREGLSRVSRQGEGVPLLHLREGAVPTSLVGSEEPWLSVVMLLHLTVPFWGQSFPFRPPVTTGGLLSQCMQFPL